MANKRDFVIAILATFCLTATVFMVIPIRSSTNTYDPWLDYNEDGKISLSDLVSFANSYGTSGDPAKNVTVTDWELDCYHRYTVELAVDKGSATVGNANPVSVYVHVTYQGKQVTTFISDNFHVCNIAGPLGAHPAGIFITFVEALPCGGCYEFQCTPMSAPQWAAGTYVFYIGVRDPSPSPIFFGESMTSFTL